MRKTVKNNLLEIFKTIYEAHGIVKGFIDKKEYENAQNLLADCQDTAIQLGNLIEESEGEGFITVSFLEEYCEALYEAATNLSEESNGYKVQKQLDKKIIKAENSAKNDLKVKLEIVFMPYKASMWDSLESVWKAADEDPDCDAYVVPIPYYERNPDHSFGVFHYEGNDYPEYVPVVHYEAYDLTKRHPDVIYIHNPYDGHNYVTSVDPRFYSGELKKYTGCLVYVPYFISGGVVSENHSNLSVYYNADKILIQSDNNKNYFDKCFHNKLFALGSPKADKALSKISDFEIPSEWSKIINGRKVFLYNTSISGLLNNAPEFLTKIEYVLNCFKKRQDVVLVWRPHPLIKSTISSMIPAMRIMYNNIVEYAKNIENVIYDETPDVTIPVKIADAYIGEITSSMVTLFGIQGKPIFLTSMFINKDYSETETFISAYDCLRTNDEYWIVSGMESCLYKIDENYNSVRYVIPGEAIDRVRLYNQIIKINDKLVLVPFNSNKLVVFDLLTYNFSLIQMRDETKYVKAIEHNSKIYMIPCLGNAIAEYNINDNTIVYHDEVMNEIQEYVKNGDYIFFNSVVKVNNLIFAASAITNKVLVFDMDTNNYKFYCVGEEGDNFWTMDYDGKDFWIASNQGCFIIRWNYESGRWEKIINFPADFCGENNCFIQIICASNFVYVFPKTSNMILKINPENSEIVKYEFDKCYGEGDRESEFYKWPSNYYFANKISDNEIATMTAYNNSILLINVEKGTCKTIKINNDFLKGYFDKKFYRQSPNVLFACAEKQTTTLGQFIEYTQKGFDMSDYEQNLYREVINNLDGTCGKKVHNYIKSVM